MTLRPLGHRTDVEANEHWARLADHINGHWANEFQLSQQTGFSTPCNPTVLAEHMQILSEIVADLARSMAEYHKWRAS